MRSSEESHDNKRSSGENDRKASAYLRLDYNKNAGCKEVLATICCKFSKALSGLPEAAFSKSGHNMTIDVTRGYFVSIRYYLPY